MPQSKPLNLSAPAQQTSPPKKNTVDYIPSKISYETAIPVSIFDDRSDFLEKCKPYDIIDGPNPLDDVPDDAPQLIASSALEAVKAEAASARSSRKRSRSPLKGAAAKSNAVKSELGEDGQLDGPKASSPHFTRPSRRGWAAEQLRDGRPYQLLQSRDMETKVRYVLDDCDYEWCAAHDFAPDVVQRGITYLEWAYVSSLLTAATPHVEDSVVEALTGARENDALTGASASASAVLRSSHNSNGGHGVLTGHFGLSSTHTGLSSSSGSAGVAASGRNGGRARRQGAQGRGAESTMVSASTCALCSKSVYLLPQHDADASGAHEGSGATGGSARSVNRGGRSGGRGRDGQSRGTSSNAVRGSASAHRGDSASVASSSAFPAHDLQHQGLRCCECGVVAHLRCWFLTEAPRLPEAWRCDGCTNYAQHRKRSAGVCCMCGRMGGVLLPYVSSAAARDDGESGHAGNSSDPSSPLLSHANGGSSGSLVAASDMVCHAVCALTMSELAIHLRPTVIRRNGSVDMEERPYVYALRRVGKQKYAMHCVFCEHGGTGRCVQCHHPHCFEAMHASCAAEAHTVDCHTDSASSPSTIAPSRATKIEGGESSPTTTTATGVHRLLPASDFSLTAGGLTTGWSGCSTYCRKHYGYSVSNAVGSAALGDKAEADALALDLTGLLTGEDGVTSPVVQKRGRGRPPVALVQQREAERRLIHQLHAYWRERREQRRRSSGQIVGEVNARLRPVVAAMLRPEIVKVSADKVRLSHFLSLVPEWQWQLVAFVEGELPLPDEEYDDVQKYRKVAHTRRSGNTRGLYDRMCLASTQLDLVCRIAGAMKQQCRLRRTSAELELETLRRLCGWK